MVACLLVVLSKKVAAAVAVAAGIENYRIVVCSAAAAAEANSSGVQRNVCRALRNLGDLCSTCSQMMQLCWLLLWKKKR